jgi:hypothetical protein
VLWEQIVETNIVNSDGPTVPTTHWETGSTVSLFPQGFHRMPTVSVIQFLAICRQPDDTTRKNIILTNRRIACDELIGGHRDSGVV